MLFALAILAAAPPARAHGGETHAADAPALPVAAAGPRAAASSERYDAVLALPPALGAGEATVYLADHATSAPIAGATATLALAGPGAVSGTLGAAGPAGVYHGEVALPGWGDYAGSLVVRASTDDGDGATDLLAVSDLRLAAPSVLDADAHGHAGGALALVGAAALGLGVGWLLGRGRGAAVAGAALLGVGALGSPPATAHGGETHDAAPVAALPGAAFALPMDSQFLIGLRTAVVAREAHADASTALGRFVARPGEAATLGAPVEGVLLPPPGGFPAPGQRVEAGELLARVWELAPVADRAAVTAERAAAATREAEARRALALAEQDAAGLGTLGGALSERDRLALAADVEVARVGLREAEAARAALDAGAEVAVRAPVAGRIGALLVRPGDQVAAGAPLFRVVDAQGLWMEARVPERLAIGLVAGAPARVTAEAAPDRVLAATVLDAGQEADPSTGTVTVTLAVEAGAPGLRPGMGATAWIARGPSRDALRVPAVAVVERDGRPVAFVKTGPERFVARAVRLGGRDGDRIEVLSGLAVGERVVTDGVYALRGMAGD